MTSELDAWDYDLPPGHIADRPAQRRDASRLMLLPAEGGVAHHTFADLPSLLRPGDLVVANDTRVMPARLRARRDSGAAVEILVLEPGAAGDSLRALVRNARRIRPDEALSLDDGSRAWVERATDDPDTFFVRFERDPGAVMDAVGEMPLPPYLARPEMASDRERYQTTFARNLGSAAAPTAGLHFTPELLAALPGAGIGFATVTLHVGIATFRPLREADVAAGRLHVERYEISADVVDAIARCRARNGRVIAVGTTTTRALEAATADGDRVPTAGAGSTDIFIRPGYRFKTIDGLITNFHLPKSSLLMLVSALVGRQRLFSSYTEAIQHGYRFYSYGDAMLFV